MSDFTIHFAGNFTPEQIQTSWTDKPFTVTPDVAALVESAWQTAMSRPGVHLFDGPMVRLDSWQLDNDHLILKLGHTSYKVFLGTNLSHPELADTLGPVALANPLGLSAALESSDGFLLLGRRNAKVAYYPNRVHPFAGSAEGGDLFAEMRRELMEELSLHDAEIADLRCIGLAEDRSIRQPELIFLVRSTLAREQIESRLDLGEHAGVMAIAATAADVSDALTREELTPIAKATLTLWSKQRGIATGRGHQD
ncbi:MAG: hypothetical protein ABSH22_20350 [Tepidisphaeraceae bacterium]|jgi:8-oxo-dGTP pyrophosphatase MutT (NUDIX family)